MIFSHADMLTGCTLDANNINKFRAYRRLICCFSPRMPRESWVGMSMAFSLTMEIFFYHMYQARMWSCSLDLVLLHGLQPPHQSPVAYCNTLKDLAKRRHVSHTSTGACGAFFSLRVLVSRCMRVSRMMCFCGNMKYICDTFYQVGSACLYSRPPPVDLACFRNHLLHAYRD